MGNRNEALVSGTLQVSRSANLGSYKKVNTPEPKDEGFCTAVDEVEYCRSALQVSLSGLASYKRGCRDPYKNFLNILVRKEASGSEGPDDEPSEVNSLVEKE